MGCHFLVQGIFLIKGSNTGLLLAGQVDARLGDDAQNLGQVVIVEGAGPFSLQDLLHTVQPLLLALLAEGQPRLQHLHGLDDGLGCGTSQGASHKVPLHVQCLLVPLNGLLANRP